MSSQNKKKSIGFTEAYSIGIGGMIGGGIFAVLGLSLQLAGYGAPIAFLISGIIALGTAYNYAKLSIRYPSEGGTIEYLVKAFGPGILSGGLNVLLLAGYIVMIALYAYAFGSYGAGLAGGSILIQKILIALVIMSFVLINAVGAVLSGRVEDALVLFKVSVLILVIGAGIGLVNWGRFSPVNWPSPISLIAGGMIIFLAYEGFELIANTAHDVEDPKILPKAFYASVLTVISIYVLIAIVAGGILPPEQVVKYRDYALAVVAEPKLGHAGFLIVSLAALASTSSAINATLYGTARISYIVAKYGELPRAIGRKAWGQAPEGLIIIAILSLLLAETTSLEAISTAGSGGFLLVFSAVNLAGFKLRKQTKINPFITITSFIMTLFAFLILIYRMASTSPSQITIFIILLTGSFLIEFLYRKLTGRSLSHYIDKKLLERERNIYEWEKWIHNITNIIKAKIRDAEIYLVGSIARGELQKAHDIDILVVTNNPPSSKEEKKQLLEEIKSKTGITKQHPIDIHFTTPREKHKWLKKSKKHRPLA